MAPASRISLTQHCYDLNLRYCLQSLREFAARLFSSSSPDSRSHSNLPVTPQNQVHIQISIQIGNMNLLILACMVFTTTVANVRSSVPATFYPYGTANGDSIAPVNDDGATSIINLSGVYPFFANAYTSLYVRIVIRILFKMCYCSRLLLTH